MAKSTKTTPTPRFNLSVQTLQIAHEALRLVNKPNAQSTFNCAQAMAEIESVLAALPQAQPVAPAEAPAEEVAPAPKRGKGRK